MTDSSTSNQPVDPTATVADESADDVTGHALLELGGSVLPAPTDVVADAKTKTGGGRVHVQEIVVTKHTDRSS